MRYPSSDDSSAVSGFSVGVCHVLDISIDIFIASLHVFFYLMIVYLAIALYIFAPYTCSRILAFGECYLFAVRLKIKFILSLSYLILSYCTAYSKLYMYLLLVVLFIALSLSMPMQAHINIPEHLISNYNLCQHILHICCEMALGWIISSKHWAR